MKKTHLKVSKDLPTNNCKMHYDKIIRYEWAILADFKKLGWLIMRDTKFVLELVKDNFLIEIDKENREYNAHFIQGKDRYITFFDMEEHKLLHELFELWRRL